jgi:hypothetical protein
MLSISTAILPQRCLPCKDPNVESVQSGRRGYPGSVQILDRRPVRTHAVEPLARFGLAAKGVSYGIVGVLALLLALGGGGKATSRQGALATLAQHGYGKALLALIALGFAAYALWRAWEALAGDEDAAWKRAGYAGRAVIYAGLTFSSLRILFGSGGGGSQNGKAHRAAAEVLSWPGGPWIVGAAGLAVIGVGLWNGYRGVTMKFRDNWRRLGGGAARWGARIGVAGHLARLVVFVLIGAFAIKAAVDFNPKDAIGFDGALQKLAHESYGALLLGLTAAGLLAYGLFCLVDARYRDV